MGAGLRGQLHPHNLTDPGKPSLSRPAIATHAHAWCPDPMSGNGGAPHIPVVPARPPLNTPWGYPGEAETMITGCYPLITR